MTKLEKLIELGYEYKDYYYHDYYVKEIVKDMIFIKIINLENIEKNCYVDTISYFKIVSQQDIDNLQLAFDIKQKDLEILKGCE